MCSGGRFTHWKQPHLATPPETLNWPKAAHGISGARRSCWGNNLVLHYADCKVHHVHFSGSSSCQVSQTGSSLAAAHGSHPDGSSGCLNTRIDNPRFTYMLKYLTNALELYSENEGRKERGKEGRKTGR